MAADPFTAGLDALYRSPAAEDATWRPAVGGSLAVRVLRRNAAAARDWTPTGPARDQTVIAIRSSEVAEPAEGDEIDLGGVVYRVVNADPHPRAPEWACEVEVVAQP